MFYIKISLWVYVRKKVNGFVFCCQDFFKYLLGIVLTTDSRHFGLIKRFQYWKILANQEKEKGNRKN